MSQFFAFLSRMKFINRWSLMRNTFGDNLSEHSFEVVMLTHALSEIENILFGGKVDVGKAISIAIYHDASETITGDMPTPVKYYNETMRNAYGKVEEYAEQRLLSLLPAELKADFEKALVPDKTSREYRLVKYADKLSAYIKTIEELSCGNRDFEKAEKTIRAELYGAEDKTLGYFLNTFIDAYKCTLDDIKL